MARLRVMSVAVRSHVIAYAFFIGDRLEYWGSSNKAAKSPEHALPVVKAWMAKLRPQVMVTERIGQDTRKKPRTISVIEAITQLAVDAPLNDIVVPRVRQFTNRYEEAEAEMRQAVDALEAALGEGHPTTEYHRFNLAWLILERGDAVEALRLAEVAASRQPTEGRHPLARAHEAYVLARAKWAAEPTPESRREARTLAQEAHDIYAAIDANGNEAEEARAWLDAHPVK